jgi:hypothetical protein
VLIGYLKVSRLWESSAPLEVDGQLRSVVKAQK